jgi:lipopolysaccharide export system permease protein
VTTYDRHLLGRFLHAFVVFFVAALGLYVVIDGFTNLDGFQRASQDQGTVGLLVHMGRHYLFQSSLLLELVGPTVAIVAVMTVFSLMCKHGELHPLLAAGVPTYRLALPLLAGMVLVNVAFVCNQEFVIPRISSHLQGSHGDTADDARQVEPCLSASGLFLSGEQLFLADQRLHGAEFRLSRGRLSTDFASLTAEDAYYLPQKGVWPAGWLLRNAAPRFDRLPLTDEGRQVIIPQKGSADVFVVTEVTFGELYNRSTSFKFLSTRELLDRVRRPSFGTTASKGQLLHLHSRLTRPAMLLVGVFLIVPVIVRREHTNLVSNIAVCTLLVGGVFGVSQGLQFVSQAGLMTPELSAWAPLIGSAGLSAWLSPLVRT